MKKIIKSTTDLSDLLKSEGDKNNENKHNSMNNLDPSHYFDKPEGKDVSSNNLNFSTIPESSKLASEGKNQLLLSKKTSSLIIDGLDESSILFKSDIMGPSDSDVLIELSNLKESIEDQKTKVFNRRETLKIFKKNREMAKLEEQKRQEEVKRET